MNQRVRFTWALWPNPFLTVIDELRETKQLQMEKSSLLDDSNCETQYEADLTSDVWMDYQEKKRKRNHEGFKIILDLATQIDQLKIDLEREIQLVDELKVRFFIWLNSIIHLWFTF